MQSLSKRKFRDEDDAEGDRKLKAGSLTSDVGNTGETGPLDAAQRMHLLIPRLRFATESWAGMKTSNEDRHVIFTNVFPGPVFGIFDGHGGAFTADFLSRQLVKTVSSVFQQNVGEKALADLRTCQELSSQEKNRRDAIVEQVNLLRQQLTEVDAIRSGTTDPDSATSVNTTDELDLLFSQLTTAISQMDSEMGQIDVEETARDEKRWQWCHEQHGHLLKSFKDAFERVDAQVLQKNPSRDGSTALLVWFLADSTSSRDIEMNAGNEDGNQQSRGLTFYTVNLGDSRAVMCRGGQAVALTSDHKPDLPDERKRIEKAGGFVGKIAGISRVYSAAGAGLAMQQESSTYLAVSRAFGDRSLKTPTPLVSCDPETKRFQVQGDDLFLVMACDGIWDVLSNQEVVDIALPLFRDAKAAADAIVKAAYKKGSVDNLTVTVVQFGWKTNSQVHQTIESSKIHAEKSSSPKGNHESDDEEIDMFNL
ncbi:Phosphomevalonate kinase [Phytophthora cinnamomi]|uniref:Phosphomevalonate kinase n=1 Tax=Phytophthora cinnamomi TaxID=4785 RepID=UPI00355A51E7|nr:Phosphomevalonate kinase [Phytophthora cinnamomi]